MCIRDRRRDILLYKMLYLTGARIQEVLDLEIDSVPLPDMSQLVGCFRQIKSKGKTRDLYVPMSLIKELDDFIMEERNLIDTDHSYIFVSEQKRQMCIRDRGFDEVYDTSYGADLTVVEESKEFIERFTSGQKMPLFTSCCPAWVKYCETKYPEFVPNLSTCRSPQQMFGACLLYTSRCV